MSLINDALRQASQAQQQPPFEPAAPPPYIQPPSSPPPSGAALRASMPSPWPSLLRVIGLFVLVVALLAVGGFFVRKAFLGKSPQTAARLEQPPVPVPAAAKPRPTPAPAAATPSPEKASPARAAAPADAPAVQAAGKAAPAPPPVAPPAPITPSKVATATEPAAPPPAPVKWPALRLQGIFFRPPGSSVVINNKTLFQDDEIQGVKVASIDRTGVTLLLEGQTNTIYLR